MSRSSALKWLKDMVKVLGVWLSTDPMLVAKLNYEDKIKNLKASLGSWELRRLSLLGKISLKKFNRISTCLRIVTSVNRQEGELIVN